MISRIGFLMFFLVLLSISFSFSMPSTEQFSLKPNNKSVTYFLIDGLDAAKFNRLISEGKLPFLAKIAKNGIMIQKGISSFPTMTGYGYYPFITGMDAARSGILGLRWFDRSLIKGNLRNYVGRTNPLMNKDILPDIKTLFELADTSYSASINCFMNRGVKESVITGWDHSAAKFEGRSVFKWIRAMPFFGEKWAMNHFEHETSAINIALEQLAKNPKVHFITFPSPDATVHVLGNNPTYDEILIHIDRLIEQYWKEVVALGQENDRMLAIISDHGVEEVINNLDFKEEFEKLGLKFERGNAVNILNSQLNTPFEKLNDLNAYFVINGNLSAYIYLKWPIKDWAYNPSYNEISAYPLPNGDSIDLVAFFAKREGVEFAIVKTDSVSLRIYRGGEYALIKKESNALVYNDNHGDVLNLRTCMTSPHFKLSNDEWMVAGADCDYPYSVPRLWALFENKSMGNILLTSAKGYDFGKKYEQVVGSYKGGHGGIRASMMVTPYIIYGKGLKPSNVETARSEDIGATVMHWLGMSVAYKLDGESLIKD